MDLFPVASEIGPQQGRLALDQEHALDHAAFLFAVQNYVIERGQDIDTAMVDKLGLILDCQVMRYMAALLEHSFEAVVPGLCHAVEGGVASGNSDSMTLDISAEIQNRRRAGLNVAPAPVSVELLQGHMGLLTEKVMMMNH